MITVRVYRILPSVQWIWTERNSNQKDNFLQMNNMQWFGCEFVYMYFNLTLRQTQYFDFFIFIQICLDNVFAPSEMLPDLLQSFQLVWFIDVLCYTVVGNSGYRINLPPALVTFSIFDWLLVTFYNMSVILPIRDRQTFRFSYDNHPLRIYSCRQKECFRYHVFISSSSPTYSRGKRHLKT